MTEGRPPSRAKYRLDVAARMRALLAIVLLVPLVAGCLESPWGTEAADEDANQAAALPLAATPTDIMPDLTGLQWTVLATDPQGDAYQDSTQSVLEANRCPQPEPPMLRDLPVESACNSMKENASAIPNAGTPGHDSRDLLSVSAARHPDALVLDFEVAELRAGFEGSYDSSAGTSTAWGALFTTDGGCNVGVEAYVLAASNGAIPIGLTYVVCDPEMARGAMPYGPCHLICLWTTPLVAEPGRSGHLFVAVPAWIWQEPLGAAQLDAAATWAGDTSGVNGRLRTPVVHGESIGMRPPFGSTADEAGPDGDTRIDPPGSTPVPGPRVVVLDDGRIGSQPAASGGWRLEAFEVAMDERVLEAVIHIATLPESAANVTIGYDAHVDGAFLAMSVIPVDGGWCASGSAWLADGSRVGVPVSVALEPGSPGRVAFTVERAQLPLPGHQIMAGTSGYPYIESDAPDDYEVGAALAVGAGVGRLLDILPPAGPLAAPPVHLPATGAQRFADPAGDTAYPTDAMSGDARTMDLELVEIASDDPDLLRVTMALVEGGSFQTPAGYDAIFYAVGIEHAAGTTMIGHYRSDERLGGAFLCAPDTTVLPTSPQDPALGGWTDIEGRILQTSGGGALGDGNAASASIVAFVPRGCFDLAPDATVVEASRLAAGTYLVRRDATGVPGIGATVHTVDAWEAPEGADLPFAPRPTSQVSVWEAPFGYANFWDILGAALAVLTIVGTVILVLRRRRMLRRYLNEIRAIHDASEDDPVARASALVALRARLHDDLLHHRLSDNHFPIIMDRLRARLTSARLTSMGEAFYAMPARLSLRLERLLDDGHLSTEEGAVLRPLLASAKMPTPVRTQILDRIDQWMAEDRDEARG